MAGNNRRRKNTEEVVPRRPAYFWWFLANILALCFAIFSWAICLDVFGNPENPRNYKILKKLGRLTELKRYTVLDVPNGTALSPGELLGRYSGLKGDQRDRLNNLLMRNYMRNFDKTLLLIYAEGDYQVAETKALTRDDFLYPGFAIRAQAMVKPDDFTEAVGFPLIIEYVFPTADENAMSRFTVGDVLEVNKNPNCAAVVHVSEAVVDDEPALMLTVIPIAYGPYRVGDAEKFSIEPPTELSPSAGLPIWK